MTIPCCGSHLPGEAATAASTTHQTPCAKVAKEFLEEERLTDGRDFSRWELSCAWYCLVNGADHSIPTGYFYALDILLPDLILLQNSSIFYTLFPEAVCPSPTSHLSCRPQPMNNNR
jgi:hypothetical protein